jgi:subtilisin family serine protease
MKNRLFLLGLTLFLITAPDAQTRKYGYNPENYPEILEESHFSEAENLAKLYGFIDWDFSAKDMTRLSLGFLALQAFDQRTIWPEKHRLPEGFLPEEWLETGKGPGLGVSELHRKGITGKKAVVAVFDKYINPDHVEFSGRIVFHRIKSDLAEDFQYRLHFHGISCASILCGKNLGVAPEATLHYFAVPDDARNSYNYCLALEKLLQINAELPAGEKIRAVSISDGISRKEAEIYERWQGLRQKAGEAGVAVICSEAATTFATFTWGGCPPFSDRNDPENYRYAAWPRDNDKEHRGKIILPADYRTSAQNRGNDAYVYWGDGGFSWAIPYFAGLAALAWGVDGNLTIEEIYRLIDETKTRTSQGRYVINPIGFIESVIERKGQ